MTSKDLEHYSHVVWSFISNFFEEEVTVNCYCMEKVFIIFFSIVLEPHVDD